MQRTGKRALQHVLDRINGYHGFNFRFDHDASGWRVVEPARGRNVSPRLKSSTMMRLWLEAFESGVEETEEKALTKDDAEALDPSNGGQF